MARVKGLWLDIADWRRVTKGLAPEERGAYIELMIACAENGGRLDNDDKALRICTALLARIWNDFRRRLMPRLFYQAPDGCWRNETVDFQLERAEKIREIRQAAGQAGAQARWPELSQIDGKQDSKSMANAIPDALAPATIRAPYVKSFSAPNGAIEEADASPVFSPLRSEKTSPQAAKVDFWKRADSLVGDRGLVGRMAREFGRKKVNHALDAIERTKPDEPASYLVACCQDRLNGTNDPDQPTWKFKPPKEPPPERLYPEEP